MQELAARDNHQQPEVNYLPRFSPLLICLERLPLRGDRSGEIDLFENLEMIHIRLLVEAPEARARAVAKAEALSRPFKSSWRHTPRLAKRLSKVV